MNKRFQFTSPLAPALAGLFCALCLLLAAAPGLHAAVTLPDVKKQFLAGKYDETIKAAQDAIKKDDSEEEWHLLLIQSLMTIGQYPEALKVATNALAKFDVSVQLRLLARDVFLRNNDTAQAKTMLDEINRLGGERLWAYTDAPNLVALGKSALLLGADPKKVLELFIDKAKVRDPNSREPYLAAGEVALSKHDYDLAAKTFSDGLKKFAEDPEMNYGLARAFAPSDRKQALKFVELTLQFNPRHVGAQLVMADHLIDAEEYIAAEDILKKVLAINPWSPEAWASRAIIRTVQENEPDAARARANALKFWSTNPQVDFQIGAKLSQKYRFAEGASHQRKALEFDPEFVPSKSQLAEDLLRLGKEDEGWALALSAQQADGYDVAAFNLVNLKDTMDKYETLTNAHFILRMGANEAPVWGDRALALLERARSNLTVKYGYKLEDVTIVEIFPKQKDFAIRTFGMPGGIGYLGVCFGSVITANSPSSQAGHPSNWEAVLWHEFCHVITLHMTKNKMPRWLSEGISVFEELQANPVWGQKMTPKYVDLINEGGLTPISELSGAFMAPKSELHLQFAYYESCMVVEFIVKNYGMEKLKLILNDLGEGKEINSTIEKHTTKMDDLEKAFAKYAKDQVEQLAPGLDMSKPKPQEFAGGIGAEFNAWRAKHGTNYYALTQEVKNLLEEKKYEEAKKSAKQLLDLYPGNTGSDNAYLLLAEAYHGLNDFEQEREMLVKLASLTADAVDIYLRVMEMDTEKTNWRSVELNANRSLAVNPLLSQPYRFLGLASENLDKPDLAIESYQTLLKLDPPAPADTHYRLGRLLNAKAGTDPKISAEAKRHVLEALEDAPRFRDAHKLLLKMTAPEKGTNAPTLAVPPAVP